MPSSGSTHVSERLPALDGLRGIAVLLVLLAHSTPPTGRGLAGATAAVLRTGWVGVDLFFVLSGFLITRILLRTRERPDYFRAFYARRARRILPLYYLALACFVWVLPAVGGAAAVAAAPVVAVQGWFWLHLVNVRLALGLHGAAPTLAFHFWSLSLEEQFYLVWPAVVLATPRRWLPRACVAAVVLALVVRVAILASGVRPAFSHLLMPARLDAFAAGALLAVLRPALVRRHMTRLLGVALVAVAALAPSLVRAPGEWPVLTVGYTGLAMLAAAAVALGAYAPPSHWLQRVGRWRTLRMLGAYSYGLYVVHVPLFLWLAHGGWTTPAIAARLGTSPWVAYPIYLAGAIGVALGAAAASWHLFENPILNGRRGAAGPRGVAREEFAAPCRLVQSPPPSAPGRARADDASAVGHAPGNAR